MQPLAPWHRRRTTRQAALVACFLSPSLLIFVLYRIVPLAWNLVLSFEAWSPLHPADLGRVGQLQRDAVR